MKKIHKAFQNTAEQLLKILKVNRLTIKFKIKV